jgi:hypothetical protein
MLLAVSTMSPILARASAAEASPGDSTWSIRVEALWESGKHVDIYPTFVAGQWARGIATSRAFNTSVHVVRSSDVKLNGDTFAGTIDVLIAPDPWMPNNKTPPDNHNKSGDQPLGTFTSFHPVGYGMLYTLTGDREYAELARKALKLMFTGVNDRDNRYGWKTPGTHFRAAPILAAVGFAYDMCYDAWAPDYRH